MGVASQGLHLSQRLALQQVLAPQLQQSLALLQAPMLELQALVQQELAQNPVLEEVPAPEPAARELPPLHDPHDPQEPPADVRYDPATEKPTAAPADDFDAEFQRLIQMDQEWRDVFTQGNLAAPHNEEEEERRQFMFDSLKAGTSLQEHLLEQVRLSELDEKQRAIAEWIVGNVDERGYLQSRLEEIAFSAGVPVEQVAEVLRVVQTFNPPGVAARDLRECLLLQLERAGRQDSLEYRIVDQHLETLAKHRYPELARALGVDLDAVKAAAERITHLEPRPGREFASEDPHYVVPEIFVTPNTPEAFHFSVVEIRDLDRLVAPWAPLLDAPAAPPTTPAPAEAPAPGTPGDNGAAAAALVTGGWTFGPVDPFARAVWDGLADSTRALVQKYRQNPDPATRSALLTALCRDLNRLVTGPSLFDRAALSGRSFSAETLARGREHPRGISRVKLNRLLLEEAFPRVFQRNTEEDYLVSTNNDTLPHLRISHTYKELMARPDSSDEVRAYIREKIRAGKYLIKSLQLRQQTLLNIGREIVRRQREFFDKGPTHLRPMTMAQVAGAVGVHETTVSRAVSGKYMQTPQGLFELRYFFTSGLPTAGGTGAVSNESVKRMILELVSQEDKNKPLSDEEIVRQLGARGILIARRTVAKYRSELNILPSHLRRVY